MSPYSSSVGSEEKAAEAAGLVEYESGLSTSKGYFGTAAGSYKPIAVPTFADKLTALMKARGWSTWRLSKATGTSQASVTKSMNGKAPPLRHLPKWADAFGLYGAEREEFLELGKSAKAAGKKDIAFYVEELEQNQDRLQRLCEVMVAYVLDLQARGTQLPAEVLEAAHSFAEHEDSPE